MRVKRIPFNRTNPILKVLKISDILEAFSLGKLASTFTSFRGFLVSHLPRPFPVVREGSALMNKALASLGSWE